MSYVIGTAGHIDHGKSTLIHALTGIDPDRLEEEKRRGMTIDLGFAYLTLPSGRLVGVVDVPGHARFIRNMLAGVHSLDAVLLVVAADEGVMPQTREHLEIVDLLEISRGLVVVTKADLVDGEWLELVGGEVKAAVEKTTLAGAAILPVSALEGTGLEELRAALEAILATVPERVHARRPRLPVDRVFTISGFGTVVTGTLVGSQVAVGDELEVVPGGRRARVRGLQQHNRKVTVAEPGTRAAINLGGVERSDLRRGDVLAAPGLLAETRRIDASARVVGDSPYALRHGAKVMLHTGTAEVPARVIVLESDEIEPGSSGWIQLYLEAPVAAVDGDHFVLRVPSPSATIAGGRFADVNPRRHHRHDITVPASLARRAGGGVLQEELAKYPRGVSESALLKASLAEPELARSELASLQAMRAGQWLFSLEAWNRLVARARAELQHHHAGHPLREGMPREELKSRLGLAAPTFGAVLQAMAAQGVLEERGGSLALPTHRPEIEDAGDGVAARLLEVLGREPFAPPSLADAIRESGASSELVRALALKGEIVRLSPEVAFTRPAYEAALGTIREIVGTEGSITVARLRDAIGASRRPVLALLEHLDAERVTRRVGDARVLRQ